jgi:hypothetical protein
MQALVLGRGVEVTRAGGRNELILSRMAMTSDVGSGGAKGRDHLLKALFLQRAQPRVDSLSVTQRLSLSAR